MIRRAVWRSLLAAEAGLEASKIAGVSLGGVTVRERLFRMVRGLVSPPARVKVFGDQQLYLPKRAAWEPSYLKGVYEPGTTALFQQIVKPGMTVVDAGAHVGYFTLLAASLVGRAGRVFAFEPEPGNFALLARNVEANGYRNVVCCQQALSDRPGRGELFLGRYSITHSLAGHSAGDGGRSVPVETTTLDDFLSRRGWPSVEVVKMDVEGWEPFALAGATRLLERCPGLKLVVEFTPSLILKAGVDPAAFLQGLRDLGFEIRAIDDERGLMPLEMSPPQRRHGSNLLCERAVRA
ncbi:MAG: FkbM family methyltransferase [Chloroflexi bacterium]|nr:FkbM family methyltransferase [Chloroflexota bacterium]